MMTSELDMEQETPSWEICADDMRAIRLLYNEATRASIGGFQGDKGYWRGKCAAYRDVLSHCRPLQAVTA